MTRQEPEPADVLTHVRRDIRAEQASPPPAALKDLHDLFAGGRWQPLILAKKICRRHHVNDFAIFHFIRLAESDYGLWGCIPDENTPTLPPDEQAVMNGLDPRSSLPPGIRQDGRPANYEPERVAVAS
jgi:hypothetical protein